MDDPHVTCTPVREVLNLAGRVGACGDAKVKGNTELFYRSYRDLDYCAALKVLEPCLEGFAIGYNDLVTELLQ